MIDIRAKIHDRFSLEFKVWFVVRRKLKENYFAINTWIFVPNSLDINPMTYTKTDFYRDVMSNIRLITPKFLLREIAGGSAIPLSNLEKSMQNVASGPTRTAIHEYEYQIKMFSAILKSSLRDEVTHIGNNAIEDDTEYLVRSYAENVRNIMRHYRELSKTINVPGINHNVLNYYVFGDEFISNIIEQNSHHLMEALAAKPRESNPALRKIIVDLVKEENEYKRSKGYMSVKENNPRNNSELVFRHSILKKYVESDLFLQARKKKDGVFVEQVYLSIAAGIAMIFATAVAFSVQQKYENYSMPLFVALVVSYMLKDRIKDMMRYFFAHKLGNKFFDNKTTISMKDIPIGWSKEAVDFISDEKTPREVMNIRSRSTLLEAENRTMDEKILLYRKLVHIDREEMEANSEYSISGINDIMRMYINRFVEKTDNPEVPLHVIGDDGNVTIVNSEKVYYLNIIMQLKFEDQMDYKRFRVVFNRLGIIELEEIK